MSFLSGSFSKFEDKPLASAKASAAELWIFDFNKAKEASRNAQVALSQRPSQGAAGSTARSEYARWGARIRGQLRQLEQEINQLRRGLEALKQDSQKHSITRKELTDREDRLNKVQSELDDMQQRLRASPAQAEDPPTQRGAGTSPWKSPASGLASGTSSASNSFSSWDASRSQPAPGPSSAELAAMNDAALLRRQEQVMKDQDASMAQLEGTVQNLKHIGGAISSEIDLHNRMLEDTNDDLDETNIRMNRTNQTIGRILRRTRNCKTKCGITVLFVALIVILVLAIQ